MKINYVLSSDCQVVTTNKATYSPFFMFLAMIHSERTEAFHVAAVTLMCCCIIHYQLLQLVTKENSVKH